MTAVEIVNLLRRSRLRVGDEAALQLSIEEGLTAAVGRPSEYLSRFVRGVAGERLEPSEQEILAKFFRVDPRMFGDREEWEPFSGG